MSDHGQDHQEDVTKEEKEREMLNEIDDGALDTWIAENQSELIGNFINDNADEFKDYCKQSFNEVK